MLFLTVLFSLLLWPATVLAAWGYTDDGSNYVIDSGSKLVIKVSKSTGDMTSIKCKHTSPQTTRLLCVIFFFSPTPFARY